MFGRIGTQPFRNVARAPVGESGRGRLAPNVNLVGGKSFTAAKLAAFLKSSGNNTVSLLPGQSFTIKNPNPALTNQVTGLKTNSPVSAVPSRDINATSYKITAKAGVTSGSDAIQLKTYRLSNGSAPAKLKGTVSVTVSVLPRGAL